MIRLMSKGTQDEIVSGSYADEVKVRWGDTEAYKESVRRVSAMGKEGLSRAVRAQEDCARAIALCMREGRGVEDEKVQSLVREHYEGLRAFYEPNLELYAGLAEMYVADARFARYYDDIAPGLSGYLSQAMGVFVEKRPPSLPESR